MGEIEALRKKAIQIPIDAEKCEFKNGSYVELKNEDESNVFSRKSMYTSLDAPTTVTVVKSYFIFTTEINETPVRFFSPSYALDPVTLKLRVMKGQISLYVDRLDHSKYYFE